MVDNAGHWQDRTLAGQDTGKIVRRRLSYCRLTLQETVRRQDFAQVREAVENETGLDRRQVMALVGETGDKLSFK